MALCQIIIFLPIVVLDDAYSTLSVKKENILIPTITLQA